MKQNYLLPTRYKIIGWCMLLPFMAGCIYSLFNLDPQILKCNVFAILSHNGFGGKEGAWFHIIENGLIDEISVIGLTISLIFISLSREKDEDEYIEKIRLYSLVQSLMISCGVLLFCTMFIYGGYYISFSLVYMFVLLFSFVVIFNVRLAKFRRTNHE